jgi:hypothetical protein
MLRDLTGGIMVSGNNKNLDILVPQRGHLGGKEQTRIVVFPIAVVQVTSKQNKGNLFLKSQLDEIFQSLSSRSSHLSNGGSIVLLKSYQRTVEMDIGCMDKFHDPFPSYCILEAILTLLVVLLSFCCFIFVKR